MKQKYKSLRKKRAEELKEAMEKSPTIGEMTATEVARRQKDELAMLRWKAAGAGGITPSSLLPTAGSSSFPPGKVYDGSKWVNFGTTTPSPLGSGLSPSALRWASPSSPKTWGLVAGYTGTPIVEGSYGEISNYR